MAISSTTETDVEKPGADVAHRAAIAAFGEAHYDQLRGSRRRHTYFHKTLAGIVVRHVLPGSRVLDIGCAGGEMLAALRPSVGVGIDINPRAIAEAREKFGHLSFHTLPAEDLTKLPDVLGSAGEPVVVDHVLPTFDYVILSGVLPQLYDLHTVLEAIRAVCHDRTRIIICTFSRLWHPVVSFAEMVRLKFRVPDESWMPSAEVRNLVQQCDFEVVRQVHGILCPVGIPLLGSLINRWLAPLPGLNHLSLCTVSVARALPRTNRAAAPASVSIIVPARNEAGNIRLLLNRLPRLAERQEVIFVEGHSRDDTWAVIQQVVAEQPPLHTWSHDPDQPAAELSGGGGQEAGGVVLSCLQQTGKGKGDAVRAGFARATGEVLIILDADISVPPEELPRFVELLARGHCEFANGSRLVYPMDKKAMRFLNMIANKMFGWLFTYLLGQPIRDTLCGTKVLRRADYLRIAANRAYFGDFDPFGDFDLLFGAARLNLKIVDVPVHYKQRVYGETNISRFRHGLLLARMCNVAARKIKFI